MNTIKIEGLYNAAYRAYSNISFDPEKRAERIVKDYEEELNHDLESMPESERQRYIDGYKKHLFAWLGAMSNCISSMITGPANFPVRRAEKANRSEHNRCVEFIEWRKKSLACITKRFEAEKSKDVKDAEQLKGWKEQVDRLFEGWLVDRFKSRLETVARTGNVELVQSVLNYLSEQQKEKNIIVATQRNSVWKAAELAEKFRASLESVKTAESTESEINGVRVVKNQQANRLQLFFDGKPEPEMISKLKHAAFKWSPSNGCWQRQLTQNAIYSASSILK